MSWPRVQDAIARGQTLGGEHPTAVGRRNRIGPNLTSKPAADDTARMAEEEQGLGDLPVRAYDIRLSGPYKQNKIASELFGLPAGTSLEADGFEFVGDVDSSLHLPPGLLPETGRTGAEGATQAIPALALLGVHIFLQTPLGDWAVGKVCDEIWDHKLRGPLRKLFKRRRKEGYGERRLAISFGAWYDIDGVYIGAEGELNAEDADTGVADLFPAAQRAGLAWVKAHGVTKPVLMYHIENGKLATEPTLSDSVPA